MESKDECSAVKELELAERLSGRKVANGFRKELLWLAVDDDPHR